MRITVLIVALAVMLVGCQSTMRSLTGGSSVIKDVSYQAPAQQLLITFPNGSVYEYSEVPEDVYQAFQAAPSAGSFYHKQIKGKYPSRKVEPVDGP